MMQAEGIVMMRELSTFKELKEQNRNFKKKKNMTKAQIRQTEAESC